MPDSVQKVTLDKDGQILIFDDEPALHALSGWSNRYINNAPITVLNYSDINVSVK